MKYTVYLLNVNVLHLLLSRMSRSDPRGDIALPDLTGPGGETISITRQKLKTRISDLNTADESFQCQRLPNDTKTKSEMWKLVAKSIRVILFTLRGTNGKFCSI